MKKKTKAFTLAEVLIALTIIGVVAAITIPTLVQKTNKQEYVSALQKAYSTLSQATNMIIAENGSPKASDGGWASSPNAVYEMFKKYLINAKECNREAGCWNHTFTYLNKNYKDRTWAFNPDAGSTHLKLVMADGMQIYIHGAVNADCKEGDERGAEKGVCAYIFTDINGSKKPNQMGRDVFRFDLKENGLFPAGCSEDAVCNADSSGDFCACKVLREGKMDY